MREVRLIDRGGFGVVHEVEHENSHFARKTFAPSTADPDEVAKLARGFSREVRVQSQIRHPNIMPVLQSDLEDTPYWFIMPLATQSYAEKIESDHRAGDVDFSPWQDILAAVEELHRLGYVHRDLKPANILLVNGAWVLADFGLVLPIARVTTILTGSRTAYGSHFYCAPEQVSDFRNTPPQADIFALGSILHDATDPTHIRVPFAQIRPGGPYGPILEKCTEPDPRKRFPTVASLRAALFDLWRTTTLETPPPEDADLLASVLNDPSSVEAWRRLIVHAEGLTPVDRRIVLESINSDLLIQLNTIDEMMFSRLMNMICEWAESTGFDFNYCDIVGDRLVEAYRIGSVRVRCQIVLAALELAVSHNRWHVMNQVGAMLGQTAENGLIDRILIEFSLEPNLERKLLRIEDAVYWRRERWHPKVALHLNAHKEVPVPAEDIEEL